MQQNSSSGTAAAKALQERRLLAAWLTAHVAATAAGKASDRRKAVSRASKAGLQFPVGRLARCE